MDYQDNENYAQPQQPDTDSGVNSQAQSGGQTQYQSGQAVLPRYPQQQRQSSKLADGIGAFFKGIWQIIKYIFFGFSIIGNLFLLLIIIVAAAAGYKTYKGGHALAGFDSNFKEYVIEEGFEHERLAVIDVFDIITVDTVELIRQQFDILSKDKSVKGVIIRIQSPGGSVVASDEIHYMINKLGKDKKVPIVAFMAGLAASGGYYTAVACDRIIAEPTTITGSIGVIMQTFTLQHLFESKLGINPVTVKSGEKKDWPNSFKEVTPEQIEYIDSKLIRPAFDRFVDLVDKGRPLLNREQILPLADGSIYYAQEAMDKGLVDQIGYLDDAIESLIEQADLTDPQVFGYEKIIGLTDLMRIQAAKGNVISESKDVMSSMQTPKLMYLWQID